MPKDNQRVTCYNTQKCIANTLCVLRIHKVYSNTQKCIRIHKSVFEYTKVYSNTQKCIRLSGARLLTSFGRKLVQRRYIRSSM
jgi:hypothetical protein